MKLIEYFNKNNILWQPIELLSGKVSNKEPQYNQMGRYMPKSNDFKKLDKQVIIDRQKYQDAFNHGAVDLRMVHHIDVDFKKDKTYTDETLKFVQECKNNFPYFLSSTKKQPHFLFKGDCGKKERIQTIYEDFAILLGGSFLFSTKSIGLQILLKIFICGTSKFILIISSSNLKKLHPKFNISISS